MKRKRLTAIDRAKKRMLIEALNACSGDKVWVALKLGVCRKTVTNWLHKYGLFDRWQERANAHAKIETIWPV